MLRHRADLSAQIRAIELALADDPRFVELSNLKAERKQVNHRLNERQKQQYSLFEEEFLTMPAVLEPQPA